MASASTTKYDPIKRGDTATFGWNFNPPYAGFNWSTVTLDCAITNQTSPTDNSGAAALRLNQALTVDPTTNIASYLFTLSHAESLTLVPNATYNVEPQLKQNNSTGQSFVTPITGQVKILQDYVV